MSSTTSGKIALVTGAGTGIGKHAALALSREGYSVALAGRRKDRLEATAARGNNNALRSLALELNEIVETRGREGAQDQRFGGVNRHQSAITNHLTLTDGDT